MYERIFDDIDKKIVNESIDFVKSIPSSLLKKMDKEEIKYPREFLVEAARRNLLGLRFPEEYGGRGSNWVTEMRVIEEITSLGAALGCLYSLVSIVGEAIYKFGSRYLKETYLIPMIKGEIFVAEALTEPRGGSDFFGATTFAEKKGDYYILNGQKRFIVGAEGADIFLVYAKTEKNKDPRQSLSVFVVERDMGVRVEKIYELMGVRGGGTGRIVFKDVKVPAKNLVGEENQGGIIFNRMMIPERLTSAAGALGLARAALEVATRYSDRRKAFGQKIRKFQAVSFMVANSISKLDAARALVYMAARAVDKDMEAKRWVSEAKKIATESGWEIVNNAMQIMGGIGYTTVYPVERYLRDMRLTMIWTGTNEIMNLLIQHEYYKEILKYSTESRKYEDDALDSEAEAERVFE